MGLSKKSAFLGSLLVLLDNAFLAQSKFILVDIFLVLFGALSLYLYFLAEKHNHKKKSILLFILAILFATLSFSIKWTGLSFLAVILLLFLYKSFQKLIPQEFAKKLIILAIVPVLVYLFIFAVNFKILYKSGAGDAFMSQAFQKTLSGNKAPDNIEPANFFEKFTELNVAMYKYNAGITATHPFSSKWYQWPLGEKPIWYWTKTIDGKVANIYFLGNPVIWWLIVFSVLLSLIFIIINLIYRKHFRKNILFFLIAGYFISILPFIFVSRVTFLYHYLPSLIFGILITALIYDEFLRNNKNQKYILGLYFIIVILMFVFLAPLSYGFPILESISQVYNIFR